MNAKSVKNGKAYRVKFEGNGQSYTIQFNTLLEAHNEIEITGMEVVKIDVVDNYKLVY